MTKEQLIVKQQLEIEELRERVKQAEEVKHKVHMLCYGIGAPLNDNKLNFNSKQMGLIWDIHEEVQKI